MKKQIEKYVAEGVEQLFGEKGASFAFPEIEISRPKEEIFGDYTTNVAMIFLCEFLR